MASDATVTHPSITPKISVIIPVYNVEKYLRECLDSVVNQTLREIEIICVNDCSPDNSQKILDEYAATDARLVLLKHEQNKGLAGARNTGLARARGDFVYFIDSDDFLACDDALEILYKTALVDCADEVIGGIVKWYEDTDEKLLDWHENYLKEEVHGQPLIKLPQLWANVVAWNKLIRRSFLKNHSIRFNESIRKHEDHPFSAQVHILANKISILPYTTYIYRQVKTGSIMSTEKKEDAYSKSAYAYDIFQFVEADEKRHIFRKMYYPMTAGDLIGSAEILARFSPSDEEKMALMHRWKRTVSILPDDFPGIPPRPLQVLKYIRKGEMERAWEEALDFVRQKAREKAPAQPRKDKELERLEKELEKLKHLNKILSSHIENVHNSYSWRITAPLRWTRNRLRVNKK